MTTHFRPSQESIIHDYTGGLMGVSAVPGSGKTFTLSHLAARLVSELAITGTLDEQEVLIVTMTNSAVNTFRHRISELLRKDSGLLPFFGYRVRTLHGLAHDIVRMRPSLVGLNEGFEIVDERISQKIIRELSDSWLRQEEASLSQYFAEESFDKQGRLRRDIRERAMTLIESVAQSTISLAKNSRWDPQVMMTRLNVLPYDPVLARAVVEIYQGYEQSLHYRGAIDFDDLIRLAIDALQQDDAFRNRLQARWPYILEDEAQDSSSAQDILLRMLSGERNWVRVGDPNQSIYTTFTSADMNILRQFLSSSHVKEMPLHESGRSSRSIIHLANALVEWACTSLLIPHLNDAFRFQMIEPTKEEDPQQNPANGLIHFFYTPGETISADKEIDLITRSSASYVREHPEKTIAILVPRNERGVKIAEKLRVEGVVYEELLKSTTATRSAAEQLHHVITYLSDPGNPRKLASLFTLVWWPSLNESADEESEALSKSLTGILEKLPSTADFLWPGPESRRRSFSEEERDHEPILSVFKERVRFWLEATALPIDQLILTIAGSIFTDPADLALAFKLATVLKSFSVNTPDSRLPEWARELEMIANNERKFLGFDDSGEGYEPRPGIITIATMHAAKGLEWDRVYLLSVSNYDFPMALEGEKYFSEKFFIRDELNLQAETLSQVRLLMEEDLAGYDEGYASKRARIDYASERLRLLYVGITRAKEDLAIIWNDGKANNKGGGNQPSMALIALHHSWKQAKNG